MERQAVGHVGRQVRARKPSEYQASERTARKVAVRPVGSTARKREVRRDSRQVGSGREQNSNASDISKASAVRQVRQVITRVTERQKGKQAGSQVSRKEQAK